MMIITRAKNMIAQTETILKILRAWRLLIVFARATLFALSSTECSIWDKNSMVFTEKYFKATWLGAEFLLGTG